MLDLGLAFASIPNKRAYEIVSFHELWLLTNLRDQGIADQQQSVQSINAFNAPLSWLRLLKYLEALSPKTRQVHTQCFI